jgi:DNA-binding transcriptional LysR family regulator
MNAKMQSEVSADELAAVLALNRGGTLAAAGSLLGVDGSTVFRLLARLEKRLHQRLFERSRRGYLPTELALALARHAERIEVEIEAARSAAQARSTSVSGKVRITTTDTVLHALVLPALHSLAAAHPMLQLELAASNEPASLTARDADIALRATRRPPGHLIGRDLGAIRVAVYAARPRVPGRIEAPDLPRVPWIAPDEALPEHPSVRWRKRHFPSVVPRFLVNSILAVRESVAAGLGVGILPVFLVQERDNLVAVTEPLHEASTQLWLLTHPESRHLRRIATVSEHLGRSIAL